MFPLLHWSIALLIILQGALGAANLRIAWLQQHLATGILVHEQLGLLILILTVILLISRIATGRHSGEGTITMHRRLAKLVHGAFYSLIFLECAIGIWMMGLLGKGLTIFIWHWSLPIVRDPHLVSHTILQLHALIALFLAGLIVIHSIAALYHHFILRDEVLLRMLPRLRTHTGQKT